MEFWLRRQTGLQAKKRRDLWAGMSMLEMHNMPSFKPDPSSASSNRWPFQLSLNEALCIYVMQNSSDSRLFIPLTICKTSQWCCNAGRKDPRRYGIRAIDQAVIKFDHIPAGRELDGKNKHVNNHFIPADLKTIRSIPA